MSSARLLWNLYLVISQLISILRYEAALRVPCWCMILPRSLASFFMDWKLSLILESVLNMQRCKNACLFRYLCSKLATCSNRPCFFWRYSQFLFNLPWSWLLSTIRFPLLSRSKLTRARCQNKRRILSSVLLYMYTPVLTSFVLKFLSDLSGY